MERKNTKKWEEIRRRGENDDMEHKKRDEYEEKCWEW